ncbi:MAG: hypothetical protein FJ390_08410, partial [Verrucomicrobia bacterium]|nr:hypothetical protein [Verrucomicrobiota bacterium]
MKSLQGVSFIFYCLFSSVILKALPHLMMEEKSSSEGGSRNSSQENLNDATWRDLSSAEASRVGSPVTAAGHDERGHKIEAIVENHAGVQPPEQLREAVESYAASLQTKQIEPAMEVLPAHSLEKEIAEAKNLATTLRQQLILKSYELTLPLPPQKAGASFLESVRQAIVPKSGQALVEESMAVIIADVTERSKARCPDNRFAQKRMTDLEKAIEQSERAVQIRDQVSEVSRPQFETQMEVRRARLAGMNQDVQETIRNLKIENDPSLAALAMKEVLKEKVEELRLDNSLFRGESNEIPTTENFIQISTLYHLTEQTLFMAEDVFAATAADALQSPESNETLNKRCDQAAALVVSLRAILL